MNTFVAAERARTPHDTVTPSGGVPGSPDATGTAPPPRSPLTPELRAAYKIRIDEARRQQTKAPADGWLHGTEYGYWQGCKCDLCRGASRDGRRERRQRAAAERQRVRLELRKTERWQRIRASLNTASYVDADDYADHVLRRIIEKEKAA